MAWRFLRRWIGIGLFATTLLLLAGQLHAAEPEILFVDGDTIYRQLGTKAVFLADPDRKFTISDMPDLRQEGRFTKNDEAHFDFGYSTGSYWIAIDLTNITQRDVTYLISANWPFVPNLAVYYDFPGRASDEPMQLLLDKSETTPWDSSMHSAYTVVSGQFIVPANASATLYLNLRPYGFGFVPFSLETPLSQFESAQTRLKLFTGFYSAAIAMLLLFSIFVIALRHTGGLYFVGLFLAGLALIAHLDGLLFAHVWPNLPLLARSAGAPLLFLVDTLSFAVAAYMLQAGGLDRWARAAKWAALLTPLPVLSWIFIQDVWWMPLGFPLLVISVALLFFAIINWAQLLPRKRQLGLLLAFLMLVVFGVIVLNLLAGNAQIATFSHWLAKFLYAIITLTSMIAYATHLAALNRNYMKSLDEQLLLARREAKTNAELLQSERKFARAQELVAQHRHQLATTSHDIKQPIASLRLTLDAMARSSGREVEENVSRAFDYLEDLVNRNLHGGETPLAETPDESNEPDDEEEAVSLGLIVETAYNLFREEAISKGLELRRVSNSIEVSTATVPVMRIISNLLSNAIKHTSKGRVLIGVRRVGCTAAIEIHDSGHGMTEADLERFRVEYEKGDFSHGTGLGLPICFDIAAKLGLDLTMHSVPERGTTFRLLFPKILQ